MNDGLHPNVTQAEYHADPCDTPSLSAGMISLLLNSSPRHAWYAHPKLNPDFAPRHDQKFDLGTAAHRYMLEGQSAVAIVPETSWRTNAAKETRDWAYENGLVPLLAGDWDSVQEMVAAALKQIAESGLDPLPFITGSPEQTVTWQEQGVQCRALLDCLHEDGLTIDDLKTTRASANPAEWTKRTMWNIGAPIQARWYQRGVKAVTGVEPIFRFVVVETYAPYALSVVSLSPAAEALADARIERALTLWKRCLETDDWPGYDKRVAYADPPAWLEAAWLEDELREVTA